MSQDIEQYRAGFEAWANKQGLTASERQTRWEGWAAAKREASTEPSAICMSQGYEGGTCMPDTEYLGGTIRLHYKSPEDAENAFMVIGAIIDAELVPGAAHGRHTCNDSNGNFIAAIAHTKAQEGK